MCGNREGNVLDNVLAIYRQALENDDGECCMVAMDPQARETLKAALEQARGQLGDRGATNLILRERTAPGLNDGLLYPGDMFPLGTPVRTIRSAAANRAPLRGVVRVVVVLAEFSDQKLTQTKKHYEDLFFSVGALPKGSVRDYFREVTNNLVDIVGDVVGPYTMPLKLTEYAHGDSGTGAALPNARTMARDAAEAANPNINFAPFDNDGDGFVDAFIVVHAGPGAESTLNVNHIWSHKWVLAGGAYNADGTKIYGYLTVPEDARIGVCCHELGHLLFGFPDLYDTDGSGEGVGNWCLMGGGSWNGGGNVPAHPSAWCKVNQGWVAVINQTTNAKANIPDVKTSRRVYRLWKNGAGGSEYFLVENRQKTLYDAQLPGEGLLIWHIDESIATNADENHPKVALLQADGKRHLEQGTNRGDAGDPFPGSANNTSFTKASTPSSKSYADIDSCVAVTGIGAPAATMTARLSVKCIVKTKELAKDQVKDKREKEIKEVKELAKDQIKDKREKEIKEIKEFKEKDFEGKGALGQEGPGAGGYGQYSEAWGAAALEERLAALEARLAAVEPFIDASQRPDLSQGALAGEEDVSDIQQQMEEGDAQAKRLFDTKPSE